MTRSTTRALTTSLLLASLTGAAHAHDTTGPKIAAAVVAAIQKCWSMPKLAEGERPHVQLKIRLSAEGALLGKPEVAEEPTGRQCRGLHPEHDTGSGAMPTHGVLLDYPHDRWREIVVNFDPPPP